jgi:microsomal dipeptidase-like Zn-dependent dipeptidase
MSSGRRHAPVALRRRSSRLAELGLALLVGASAEAASGCKDPHGPAPCAIIDPVIIVDGGVPDGAVVGFADLHAHPATQLAFGGRLIWGSAIDKADVNASELPRIAPCPVETHNHDANSPVDRTVGGEVFPKVATLAGFPHGPPSGVLGSHQIDTWPNARDIIHQQMNVAAIRRAYEGGLRLMFAATTDDQVFAALLAGPNFVNGFVPDKEADYRSARRQLDLIEQIVEQNSNWMDIADSPQRARAIIGAGKLALVLSLEMNGLTQADVDSLVNDYHVAHIIPIHLIDNSVGGTAANGSLFNAASAAVSQIYRADQAPMRFMDVDASDQYKPSLGLPQELGSLSLPVYVGLNDLPYPWYRQLCYEPLGFCDGPTATATPFIQFGQVNARGLCSTLDECNRPLAERDGARSMLHFMQGKMMIDVSHMSAAAVDDTLQLANAQAGAPYTLIASHGDIAHLCNGFDGGAADGGGTGCVDETRAPVTERSLDSNAARAVTSHQGVLGLGTGLQIFNTQAVLAARGGPIVTLVRTSGQATACVAKPDANQSVPNGCATVDVFDSAPLTTPVQILRVETLGGPASTVPNAQPFVRVELRGPDPTQRYQRHVVVAPLECSTQACRAEVDLGNTDPTTSPAPPSSACASPAGASLSSTPGSVMHTLDDVESVTLEWIYLACDATCQNTYGVDASDRQCTTTWDSAQAPLWPIEQVTLTATGTGQPDAPFLHFGPRADTPLITLGRTRGSIAVYQRSDRADAAQDVPASGHLLEVSLHSAPGGDGAALPGAGASRRGSNVCIALRQWDAAGVCETAPAIAPGAIECPTETGWANIDPRGAWAPDVTLSTFVHFSPGKLAICGVDVAILDWNDETISAFPFDEVRVDAIDDPVNHWARRYAAISRAVADGEMGTVALGTDFNGLNGLMEVSEFPAPAGATAPSACGGSGFRQPLAPMRFRNDDGTLGGEIRIEERGLATYGQLADFLAAVATAPGCGQDVHDSIMLSAEATIRAWEAVGNPSSSPAPLPKRAFQCAPPPDQSP